MKAVLSLLALACVVIVAILTVNSINEYKEANPQQPVVDYNEYVDETPTSGGDIIIDDNSTVEMDSISSGSDIPDEPVEAE